MDSDVSGHHNSASPINPITECEIIYNADPSFSNFSTRLSLGVQCSAACLGLMKGTDHKPQKRKRRSISCIRAVVLRRFPMVCV
jgi:hypothetical protein